MTNQPYDTQPDHIVDVHEMVTDTNQASEAELKDRLTKLISQDGWVDTHEVDVEGQVAAIQSIIRTEKLKLLAEVREEAFSGGLSFELDDGQIVIEVETDLQSIITKLEAEL